MQFTGAHAHMMAHGRRRPPRSTRREFPVHDVGADFALATLEREEARAIALIEGATRHVPRMALVSLDAISRRWLAKQDSAHLAEIDAVARRLALPGAYFLSVNYEWGCTCRVAPAPDRMSARLVRVLDWRTPGLGRHVIAARVAGAAGPFVTLTWPGYTGVLQAMAPGRFAAALNQAPMRKPLGRFYLDWAVNRARVWRMPHLTPAHLLREVFESARTFAEAKRMLARAADLDAGDLLACRRAGGRDGRHRAHRDGRARPRGARGDRQPLAGSGLARARARQRQLRRVRQMLAVAPGFDAGFRLAGAADPQSRHAPRDDRRRKRRPAHGARLRGRREPATAPLDLAP